MNWPFEWQVGWRYTRSGRGARRNTFISFISGVSMLGIALGVAALIIVLSVMNGFQKEVRDRMLAVVSHAEIMSMQAGGTLSHLDELRQRVLQDPDVLAAAPVVNAQALVARGEVLKGSIIRGIDPALETQVTDMAAELAKLPSSSDPVTGSAQAPLAALVPGQWNVLVGTELARQLGLLEGDMLTLMAPGGQMTPAGMMPRLKQVRVAGIFRAGHFEYDSALVLMHLQDAQALMRLEGPTGMQLKLKDLHRAPQVAQRLRAELGSQWYVADWTRTNRQWFDAVQVEKRLMSIILTLIVAVAAFNLVSTLVMTVTDKQSDIAILRTLGASPRSIMAIFMVQGALAGVVGTLVGVGLGLLVAFHVGDIVHAIESLLQVSFLPAAIYLIQDMPSDPQWGDVLPISLISLALAFLATLYPAWRASRVQPAEALRHE